MQLKIEGRVEAVLKGGVLLLRPVTKKRQNWFDGYQPEHDISAFEKMVELES